MLLSMTTHEEAALDVGRHGGYVLAGILQLLLLMLALFPDRSHHNSSCSLSLFTHLAASVYSLSAVNFRVAAVGAALVFP
jgi:hypothetical protein